MLQTPSTISTLADYTGDTVLGIGYLVSFQHMGHFNVDCISGCHCDGIREQDASWAVEASVHMTVYMSVSQSTQCQVRISSTQNTTSGEHKIKINTIIAATGVTERWAAYFNKLAHTGLQHF